MRRRPLDAVAAQLLVPDAPLARFDVIAVMAAVPVLAVVAVLRASATLATTTVWAEDGRIFLADAVNRGIAESLLRTYNGYLHVPARLTAGAASVGLNDSALVLSGVPCAAVAALAGLVYLAARPHVSSRLLRAVLALSVALLPIAASETLANAANLHWFLIFAAFWAALWVPASWPMRTASAAVVFFALTSDPFPLVLAPLVLLRFATSLPLRDKLYLPIAFTAGAALQVFGVLTSRQQMAPPDFGEALRLYPFRVILTTAAGFRGPTFLFSHLGWLVVYAAAIGAVVVLVALFLSGDRREIALPIVAVTLSVAMFVLYAGLRWSDRLLPVRGEPAFHTDSRYSVTPSLLLLSAVVVLISRMRADAVRRAVAGVLLVVLAATWAVDFRVRTTRGARPAWSQSLRAARVACANGAARVQVEVQPLSRPVPWAADLPCSAIER